MQEACEVEEIKCKEEADKAAAIKKDCEDRLEAAMPAYRQALSALQALTKNDLMEVKSMLKPPPGVRFTMEAVCKLLKSKPVMVPKQTGFGKEPDWWETAKKTVLNRPRLMDDLLNYEKDNIDPDVVSQIEKIVKHGDFQPEKVRKASIAAYGLSMWVRAMYSYDKVMKEIRPKEAALAEANAVLKEAEEDLAAKKENLR